MTKLPTTQLTPLSRGHFLSIVLLFNFIFCALITQQHIRILEPETTTTTTDDSLEGAKSLQTTAHLTVRPSNHLRNKRQTHVQSSALTSSNYENVAHQHHEDQAGRRTISGISRREQETEKRTNNKQHGRHKKRRRRRRRAEKFKRQAAVELAINELHILESLDEQLEAFADSARLVTERQEREYKSSLGQRPRQQPAAASRQQQVQLTHEEAAADDDELLIRGDGRRQRQQQVCSLNLIDGLKALQTNRRHYESSSSGRRGNSSSSWSRRNLNCLEERTLWRFIPPYVLNLYRQLIAELIGQTNVTQFVASYQPDAGEGASNRVQQRARVAGHHQNDSKSSPLSDFVDLAVHLMPYQAQIMRSFRQPPVVLRPARAAKGGDGGAGKKKKQKRRSNFISERENFKSVYAKRKQGTATTDADEDDGKLTTGESSGQVAVPTTLGTGKLNEQLVVELSTLPFTRQDDDDEDDGKDNRQFGWRATEAQADADDDDYEGERGRARAWPTKNLASDFDSSDKSDNYNLNILNRPTGAGHHRGQEEPQDQPASPGETGACDFSQRLLAARQRNELCFWFNVDQQIQQKINGSLEQRTQLAPGDHSSSSFYVEQLVEAELHLFKLPPQVSLERADQDEEEESDELPTVSNPTGQKTTNETSHGLRKQSLNELNDRSRATNLYHLKTNLLEVSLYQILPRKDTTTATTTTGSNHARTNDKNEPESTKRTTKSSETTRGETPNASANNKTNEYPLRLLDIRRIDLDSSGWETFYVKRAVEDWLRDEKSNLGLVIKARSMFDEPIEIGLIRFVDVYDHQIELKRRALRSGARHRKMSNETNQANANFDLSHQPLLVIYTTTRSSLRRQF